ncbi:MAG: hypothetical protein ACRDH7_15750 [Actinomycetota bacterium]
MGDPFLTALVDWLNAILPPDLQLGIDQETDDLVEVNGHGARLSSEDRRSPGEIARRLAWRLLDAAQQDVVEGVLWGTPWPGPPDGHELPSPEVEIHPDGVFVGYVDKTGWVARSPKLPLPERWSDRSLSD